jgi:hypothetical protein
MITSPKALLIASLVATSAATQISGNVSSPQYFEELERYWTYGRSPPVYPSRESSHVIIA